VSAVQAAAASPPLIGAARAAITSPLFIGAARAAIASALLLLAATAAAPEEKTISLPPDSAHGKLKVAPGSDLAQTQCQLCHSTDYIVTQPPGDAKQWEAVVTKMQKVFGAPLGEADAKAIVEYLSTAYGK